MVAVKQLSTNCDFSAYVDDALRDKFVSGLRSGAIQRKLQAETNVTFKSACDTALSLDMVSCNTLKFSGKMKESETLNGVHNQNKKRDGKQHKLGQQSNLQHNVDDK